MQLTRQNKISRASLGILFLTLVAGVAYLIRNDAGQLSTDIDPRVPTKERSTGNGLGVDTSKAAGAETDVPTRYLFAGNAKIPRFENDDTLYASYSLEQQAVIRGFYSNFGDTGLKGPYLYDSMFAFRNQRQLDWMAKNGYPLPDDVLAAAQMTTEDLFALAKKGNFKAKALLLVREYEQDSSAPAAESGQMEHQIELAEFQNEVLMEGSPFAGYVWAAKHMKKPTSDGRAGVIAGYAFAQTMGDDRASVLASAFARTNPGMDPVEAVATYRAMLMTASRNPQLSNLTNLMRRPNFEMY